MDKFNEYEEFLKKKEEFIKKVELNKERKRKITFGLQDDIERGMKEFERKLNEESQQDIGRDKSYIHAFIDTLSIFFRLLLFNKKALREAYIKTSTKRLFLIYILFSLGFGISLLFWSESKVNIVPYTALSCVIGPFILYTLNEVLSRVQQAFFFLFSGENKAREITIINAYSFLLFIPGFYFPTSFGIVLWLTAAIIFVIWLETWALSYAFKINKWQTFSATILIFFLMLGVSIFFQAFKSKISSLL